MLGPYESEHQDLLRPLGLIEISRTGIAAIARGTRTLHR